MRATRKCACGCGGVVGFGRRFANGCAARRQQDAKNRYGRHAYRPLKGFSKAKAERGFTLIDLHGQERDSKEFSRWLMRNEVC